MSKADTLGPARSLETVRSARRSAISKIEGEDSTAALTELPVTVISDNPDNPRNHLRALDETADSIRELGVILPIVVATVEAYLHNRPDRSDDIDDGAQYVVVDGHRRLEASRRVGLATIPVRVDNARVATDESLLEAAFVANYHRDNMTPLEEAHALAQLVEHYGSQTQASRRLGIPQGTISTKLSLLKLAPELQKDLMTGDRTAEQVRNLGKLSPKEQVDKADQRRQAAQDRVAAPRPVQQASGPADYHAVIIPEGQQGGPAPAPAAAPVQETAAPAADPAPAAQTSDGVPDVVAPRRAEDPEPDQAAAITAVDHAEQRTLPYGDGLFVAQHLIRKMPSDALLLAIRLLNEHAEQEGLNVTPEHAS